MVSRFARMVRAGGLGATAQIFTLTASLVPVLFGRTEALVMLVTLTAVSTVLQPALTLASSHTLPMVSGAKNAARRLQSAFIFTVGGSIIAGIAIGVIALALGTASVQACGIGLALFGLAASQAIFTLLVAWLTWQLDPLKIMRARFLYGVLSLALTVVVTLLDADPLFYVGAIAVAYLISAGAAVVPSLRTRNGLPHAAGAYSVRRQFAHVRGALSLVGALTAGAFAGQLAALAVPFVGPASEAWAAIVRVTSGFQTLGAQVVGVDLDVRLLASLRARDTLRIQRTMRTIILASVIIGVACAVVATPAGALLSNPQFLDSPLLALYAACGVAYAFSAAAISPIGRMLGFVGRQQRMVWDGARFIFSSAAILFARGLPLLLLVALITASAYVSYTWWLFRAVKNRTEH